MILFAIISLLPFALLVYGHNSENEIFSSTTELKKLYRYESEVVNKLKEYAGFLEKDLKVIQKYIDDFNMIHTEGPTDSMVTNPFNAYHILKRTVVDWEDVAKAIKNQSKVETLLGEVIKKSELLPTFEDFIGGSNALVLLQDTFNFSIHDFTYGSISEEKSIPKSPYRLTARDCLFLGKAAFNKGLYDRAIGWLETSLMQSEEEKKLGIMTAGREEILPFLETTRRVHDEILEKRGPVGETWQTFPTPLNSKLASKKKYQALQPYRPKIYEFITTTEENDNFKHLCREEDLRDAKLDAALRCKYLSRQNTKSMIGPFKVEEKSIKPYITLFHDFMGEKEMDFFKNTASSRLKRSLHQGRNGNYVATDIRTSKQAWMTMEDGPQVGEINSRITEATGLITFPEIEASELFQVANYGMAGRYTPHTDYITGKDHLYNPMEQRRGNRIATFMIYLQNVHAGGSTVFPLIGVRVKPIKGAAVFWWNLHSDGTGDPLTRHGACPVLYGEKWIANKWIRSNYQFLTAPCPRKQPSSTSASDNLFY